ncbi:MAG: hypothetical protein Q7J84_01525 [Sulfuricaulis sp.]|nr:hypothetical protein [Sulfuricaulis sp.]
MITELWQSLCRNLSVDSNNSPAILTSHKTSWLNMALTVMIAITIAACGSGGGGGGGSNAGSGTNAGNGTDAGSTPISADFVVSGTVLAPGRVVALLPQKNIFAKLTDFFISPAYAAITGLASVPDNTHVDLVRIDNTGYVITVLATTKTTGGAYSFNLSKLGLTTANDLVVQVISLSNGAKMRAFVVSGSVNIDPASETAVRLVLEKSVASSLNNFTIQELADIGAAVNLLVMTKPLASGLDIEATVTAFKNAVAADANITSFVIVASAIDQTLQGIGDIGNYFPFDQGNTWVYQVTEESGGNTTSYTTMRQITGTKLINNEISATIFHETNPGNSGVANDDYLVKGNLAITNYGNNDGTDFLTPQFTPYREYVFPLGLNASFSSVSESGLSWPDQDRDGNPETASLNVTVTVVGFEDITVSAGTFTNAAKIVTNGTITIIFSRDDTIFTDTFTGSEWFAPGIGLVKSTNIEQFTVQGVTDSTTTTEELAKFSLPLVLSSISAGGHHTCGLTTKGAAYCWGANYNAQLGNGPLVTCSSISSIPPTPPCLPTPQMQTSAYPIPVSGGIVFASLSVGGEMSCGLTVTGAAYCWGASDYGLGDGVSNRSGEPVAVASGLAFSSLSVKGYNTCGLTKSGAAYCWGSNVFGQLGNGTTTNSTTPVPVAGNLSFTAISTGYYYACALAVNGMAYCWGQNAYGQLGNATQNWSTTPVPVAGDINFTSLSAGVDRTCGITANGSIYCWGNKFNNGMMIATTSPAIESTAIALVSLSVSGHTCGLTSNGFAYCWGSNSWGQVGNGTESLFYIDSPAPVSGGIAFASVETGGQHTCGITTAGRGYCWGWNFDGQLGIGTSALTADYNRNVPVPVLPPLLK